MKSEKASYSIFIWNNTRKATCKMWGSSAKSAVNHIVKTVQKLNFGKGFWKDWLISGLTSVFSNSLSRGLNAVLNVSSYAVTTTINGGNITLGGLLFSSAIGVITGIVGGSGLMNGNTMASAAAAFGAKNFFRTIGANFWEKGFDIAVRNSINAFIIGGVLNGAYSRFSYWLNPQGQFVGW